MAPSCTSFVITPYLPGDDGVLSPKLPLMGPCSAEHDGECRLSVDHRRARKTGPCFPITVMRCREHGHSFTLYPPGHVPYGRRAVAPVAVDGSLVQGEDGELYRLAGDGSMTPARPSRRPLMPPRRSHGLAVTRRGAIAVVGQIAGGPRRGDT